MAKSTRNSVEEYKKEVLWKARPIELHYVVASILELNPNITEEKAWEIIKKIYINI